MTGAILALILPLYLIAWRLNRIANCLDWIEKYMKSIARGEKYDPYKWL
jgi:hypothetical protein